MYWNLGGLLPRYLNGYLGSILTQDYVILSNFFFFHFQCFVEKLFGLSFYKQFQFYGKHKDSSNTAMIFLRWKRFAPITIRGYTFQIILGSYYYGCYNYFSNCTVFVLYAFILENFLKLTLKRLCILYHI